MGLMGVGECGRMGDLGVRMGKQWGFTLIELMVACAVLAVLVGLAYPSFVKFQYRMESKKFKASLMQANREAQLQSYLIKRNVVMCLADDLNRCHKTAKQKALVFVDVNENAVLDGVDVLVQEYPLNLKYAQVEMRVSASRHYVKYFGSTGMPRGHFGHIKYCSFDGQFSHRVIISHMGRVRAEEGC